jgi:predicted nucleic acid-binding protein
VTTALVVDASVAIKWVLHEPDRDLAYDLLNGPLLAPDLMLIECANALRSRVARGGVAAEDAQPAFAAVREAPVRLSPAADLLTDALALGMALRHPVYDCVYLALALNSGSRVVTADRRFGDAVGRKPWLQDRVVLLSDLG